MKTRRYCYLGCLAAPLALLVAGPVRTAQAGDLRVGVAKVDITPTDLTGLTNLWRTPFTGVHDPIYLRALVLDDGTQTAAIVAADLVEFGDTLSIRQRVFRELGIAPDHVILTASHNHSAPRVGLVTPGASAQVGGPATAAYTETVYRQIVDVLRCARAAMQPAKVGIGTGTSDVNINRDEYTSGGWILGNNPDGPSEKTVWVVRFDNLAGEPIALLLNYAVHSVVLGPENTLVTGDIAGAAERFVEHYYKDKVVALWTIGAAGDQNPKYMAWEGRADREDGYPLMNALGQVVGEEIVRVAGRIDYMTDSARLDAAERVVTCPAQVPIRQRQTGATLKAETIDIRLGLIMLNQIAITAVSGEVVTRIYWNLRKVSPVTGTIMITMANDRVGYIPDDASYDTPSFEVTGTPLQRGCAESGIVNGLSEMIASALRRRSPAR